MLQREDRPCWRCEERYPPGLLYIPKHSVIGLVDNYCVTCWSDMYHGEQPMSLFSAVARFPLIGQNPVELKTNLTRITSRQPLGLQFHGRTSLIKDVQLHGPGYRAGLEPGMRIVKIDGHSVNGPSEMKQIATGKTTLVITVKYEREIKCTKYYQKIVTIPEVVGSCFEVEYFDIDDDVILDSATCSRILHVFENTKAARIGIVPGMKLLRSVSTSCDGSMTDRSPAHTAVSSSISEGTDSDCTEQSLISTIKVQVPLLKRQRGVIKTVVCWRFCVRLLEPVVYNNIKTGTSIVEYSDLELGSFKNFKEGDVVDVSISISVTNSETTIVALNPVLVNISQRDVSINISDIQALLSEQQKQEQICQMSVCCDDISKCQSGNHIPDTRRLINITEVSTAERMTYYKFTTYPFKFLYLSDLMRPIDVVVVPDPYSQSIVFWIDGIRLSPVSSVHLSTRFIQIPELKRCIRIPCGGEAAQTVLENLKGLCLYSRVHVNIDVPIYNLRLKTPFRFTPVSGIVGEGIVRRWSKYGCFPKVLRAWDIHSDVDYQIKTTLHNMSLEYGNNNIPIVEAYHGSGEHNIISIAKNGFDKSKRCGQFHGAGEYFAKNPVV